MPMILLDCIKAGKGCKKSITSMIPRIPWTQHKHRQYRVFYTDAEEIR